MRVGRGPDWKWGDQDKARDGSGRTLTGVVKSIKTWRGVPGTAVKVQWEGNSRTNVYRVGFDVGPKAMHVRQRQRQIIHIHIHIHIHITFTSHSHIHTSHIHITFNVETHLRALKYEILDTGT